MVLHINLCILYFEILNEDFADTITYIKIGNVIFIVEPNGKKEPKLNKYTKNKSKTRILSIISVIVMNFYIILNFTIFIKAMIFIDILSI